MQLLLVVLVAGIAFGAAYAVTSARETTTPRPAPPAAIETPSAVVSGRPQPATALPPLTTPVPTPVRTPVPTVVPGAVPTVVPGEFVPAVPTPVPTAVPFAPGG